MRDHLGRNITLKIKVCFIDWNQRYYLKDFRFAFVIVNNFNKFDFKSIFFSILLSFQEKN